MRAIADTEKSTIKLIAETPEEMVLLSDFWNYDIEQEEAVTLKEYATDSVIQAKHESVTLKPDYDSPFLVEELPGSNPEESRN